MKGEYFDSEKNLVRARAISPRSLQRWPRQFHSVPRALRIVIVTTIALALFFGLRFHIRQERDFLLKQTPSDFTALAQAQPEALWHTSQPVRQRNGTHIGDRYVYMRQLGQGREGSAALYLDLTQREVVVVKTYFGTTRNPIPQALAGDFEDFSWKWQAEIEASMLLGSWKNGNETAYVPLRDYFILDSEEDSQWHWAIVTPFVEAGTLENLATATKIHERTPQKLDKIFRPVFDKVLENLQGLHAAGYCHDDIKPDNIFIADTKHWLLGDLGSVRHIEHPWHATARWQRENQWADCALNDVRRLLKTYLSFLRDASGDSSNFGQALYAEEQAWSKMYWQFMRNPISDEATLHLSKFHDPAEEPEWKLDTASAVVEDACLRRKIHLELRTMVLHYQLRDWWPFRRC
ncbi:hypothetical protein LTR37_004745 [Vermiconidia calcicola]|uniref:Uncharacterized protein n=1 Tax=Vermiconidia calcicola TaxID=1690605 RepID=A0ACC3NL14_9PEZI|nr:hypothetical protein LTR37_004745 [Vermiconidia calcicola]